MRKTRNVPLVVMVTNTIVPYCYDIGHVLGLPRGFSHRFRYWEKWVKLSGNIGDIRGRHGVVVLRDFSTGTLVPIRRVRFLDVESMGDVHYIEFGVDDYLDEAARDNITRKMVSTIREKGFVNAAGEALECLVFEIDSVADGQGKVPDAESDQRWMRTLRTIGHFDCYRDFGFLRIRGIHDSVGLMAAVARDEAERCFFRLKPSGLYFLDIAQHIPWEIEKTEAIKEPYDTELKAENSEITILRGLQRVVGKYDVLKFIFKTASGEMKRQTFVEVESRQGGEAGKYGLRSLFLPVRIELPGWKKLLRAIRIFVGVLAIVAALGPDLVVPVVRGVWPGINIESVRALALVVLVLVSGKFDEVVTEFVKETKTVRLK